MFYGLSILDQSLWALTIFGHAVLLWLLVTKHRRNHPIFTAFIGASLIKSLILVAVHWLLTPTAYFCAYYLLMGFMAIILAFVVVEVAGKVFAPYNTIPAEFVVKLVGAVMVSLFLAFSVALLLEESPSFWAKLIMLERFSRMFAIAGIGVTALVAHEIGLPWDRHTKAIATGLLFALVVININSIFALYGDQARFTRPVGAIASLVALGVWLNEFRKSPPVLAPLDYRQTLELVRWLGSLRERLDHIASVS